MATSTDLFDELLAAVRRHFHDADPGSTFELGDFLHAYGRASDALLYAALFCPPLLEIDGSILLRGAVENDADRQRFLNCKTTKGRTEAERSFNFVEVPYLFGGQGRRLPDDDDRTLAQVIASSWRAWLHARFPGRKFAVELLEPQETGSVVGIQFFELV